MGYAFLKKSLVMLVTKVYASSKDIESVLFCFVISLKPCLESNPDREKLFAVFVNDFLVSFMVSNAISFSLAKVSMASMSL